MLILLFRALSLLPLRALHGLGALAGLAVWRCSPAVRQRALDNARRAGYADRSVARRSVLEAAKGVAELPFVWMRLGAAAERVVCDDWDVVRDAWARGAGLLFLTPHLGCFEVTAQYYARQRPITVLYRPPRKAWLAPLVEGARRRSRLDAAPATLAGVRQLLRTLRRGEAVGLLPDQVPSRGEGVWAPFFGQPAYTMTLPARLAASTGAAIVLAYAERLPAGRGYRLHLEPFDAPLPVEPAEQAALVNSAMEKLIRRCPEQYLWSYNRYKTPAGGRGPEPA
jgi:KDO2-lipid IV(A) lauroyltransferase